MIFSRNIIHIKLLWNVYLEIAYINLANQINYTINIFKIYCSDKL